MRTFKIRSSQVGKIMGNDKAGTGLGQTVKSYLDQWIKEQVYGRVKEFSNKYTQKGINVEQDSLDFVADVLGYGLLFKNEKRYGNKFMHGTPDSILVDHIIDVKSSWDNFTFPLFEKEIPEKDYEWQGQSYMELVGVDHYKLIYVLADTPEEQIIREANSYCWKNHLELDDEILNDFRSKMTYSNVPAEYKIKVFEFGKEKAKIDQIKDRVELCRQYIKERTKEINYK